MTDGQAPTLLIQIQEIDDSRDAAHVERAVLSAEDGEIPVARILDFLGDRGIQSLLVEGGPNTWRRFLKEKMVDYAHICCSPVELNGTGNIFDTTELEEAGLSKNRELIIDVDTVSHWS